MIFCIFYQVNLTGTGLFLNRTGAEIGFWLDKKCKKSFFIIQKFKNSNSNIPKASAQLWPQWCYKYLIQLLAMPAVVRAVIKISVMFLFHLIPTGGSWHQLYIYIIVCNYARQNGPLRLFVMHKSYLAEYHLTYLYLIAHCAMLSILIPLRNLIKFRKISNPNWNFIIFKR